MFAIEEPACQTSNPGYAALPGLDNGSLYRFESMALTTWRTAEATCVADGAHLVVPDTQDELTAIYVAMPTFGIMLDAWAGVAREPPDTTFYFVTGGAVPAGFWKAQEPGSDDKTNVGMLVRDEGLQVVSPTATNDTICECDGQSVRAFSF